MFGSRLFDGKVNVTTRKDDAGLLLGEPATAVLLEYDCDRQGVSLDMTYVRRS